jgi:hypothetical protein
MNNVMKSADESWKRFYKAAGIFLFLTAFFFFFGLILNLMQKMPSGTTEDQLRIIADQKIHLQTVNALYILADICVIIGLIGVYLSLINLKRNQALIGAIIGILGAVLAIGLRFGIHAEVALCSEYVASTSEIIKAGYMGAFELMKRTTDIGLMGANILLGAGGLLIGIAMLSGVFNKSTAILFIIANILYIIGTLGSRIEPILLIVLLIAALIIIISMIFIGLRLFKIGS